MKDKIVITQWDVQTGDGDENNLAVLGLKEEQLKDHVDLIVALTNYCSERNISMTLRNKNVVMFGGVCYGAWYESDLESDK